MSAFIVLQGGMLTTVQDLGRPGHAALGVAHCGAADSLSLRVGNRLVGNDDGAAALEFTLVGGALRSEGGALIALTGAPLAATLEVEGRAPLPLPRFTAIALGAGSTVRLGGSSWGVRAYLCVRGGIDVPAVLGSRATHAGSGLGGHLGRALRSGDRLPLGRTSGLALPRTLSPGTAAELDACARQSELRATDGAHAAAFRVQARAAFWRGPFLATDHCDRAGARLAGPRLPPPPGAGMLTSEGLPCGAVEIPAAGEAIVLLADGPPTGGYPTIASVATVDHPRLGQLRPRETIRFTRIELAQARALFLAHEAWLDREVPPA